MLSASKHAVVATEHRLCRDDELAAGEMKLMRMGPEPVLLCRDGQTIRAVQPLCPHYQMPLSDSLACGGVLQCSWHQSRFDLSTGAVLDPPALSPLLTYPVRVVDGWICVTLRPQTPASAPTRTSDETLVLLGGGAAGHAAALRLRELGFAGRLVQVIHEPHAPYDRPNLSKEHLSGAVSPGDLPLPPADVVRVHRRAVAIDPAERIIRFADRSRLPYDRLLLATGSVPVQLNVPGAATRNVFTLRSRADGERLMAAARGSRRAVVVGSSFIGMEVAAALRERGLAVTVVTSERAPFARVLGPEIGAYFRALHQRHGVRFRFRSKVRRVIGGSTVQAVQLDTGERLAADLIVVGIGVRPATDWLPPAWLDEHGRIPVDASLSLPGVDTRVFAAGDIAAHPDPLTAAPLHVEHWRVAQQQGRRAAENMLAAIDHRPAEPFRAVPYFWSYQLGQGLDYVGHANHWDEVIIDGDLAGGDFLAYYRQGDHIPAAASVGRSLQTAALLQWMTRHGLPSAEQVRGRPDWVALVKE